MRESKRERVRAKERGDRQTYRYRETYRERGRSKREKTIGTEVKGINDINMKTKEQVKVIEM